MTVTTGILLLVSFILGAASMYFWAKTNPKKFEDADMLESIIEQACLFAEKLIPGNGTGAEKRKFALEWIEAALEPYGIHYDAVLVGAMIDALIEKWNERKETKEVEFVDAWLGVNETDDNAN